MPEQTIERIRWSSYEEAATTKLINNVARERGYSLKFVERLRTAGYLGRSPEGRYNGWTAFPVCNIAGAVVAVHLVNRREKAFAYEPSGVTVHPFVIGELNAALVINIFESQWDMFAVMDRLDINPTRVPPATPCSLTMPP